MSSPAALAPPLSPPPPLRQDLKALPRTFWVLFLGTFINRFGSFVMPFLTIYLKRHGYSLTEAGFAIGAFGLGICGGSMFGGQMADRIGRRNTIVLGTYATGAFFMLLYYAEGLPAIMALAAVAGFFAGTYGPAASALLADVIPDERRVRAYAAMRLALNAGFAAGTASAGIIAKYSFFWLFAGDALTTVLYGTLALFALPHGTHVRAATNAPWAEALRDMRANRSFVYFFLSSVCLSFLFTQFSSTYPAHIMATGASIEVWGRHVSGETLFGFLMAWNGIMVVAIELPLTAVVLRFNARKVIALGDVLAGVGFALNAWAYSVPMLFIAMTIHTLGEILATPVHSAQMARLAPAAMRGRYMGVMGMAWSFAAIMGPQMGLNLYGWQPQLTWLLTGALGLVGAALVFYGLKERRASAPVAEAVAEA